MNSDDEQRIATRVERRNGRLHSIQEVRDSAGELLSQVAKPLQVELHGNDIAQLIAGASALAIPIAFTEEVWALGSTLSRGRILLIALTSVLTLAFFVRSLFYPGKHLRDYRLEFIKRVVASYLTTLAVAMLLLILIDKGPFDDLALALRRAVLIAFPASFAATAVDYIK
jgi:uncharacterized membrane protein